MICNAFDNAVKVQYHIDLYSFCIHAWLGSSSCNGNLHTSNTISPQIAMFVWHQHGAHLGPVRPRWAPWWPHELCYQDLYCMTPLPRGLVIFTHDMKKFHIPGEQLFLKHPNRTNLLYQLQFIMIFCSEIYSLLMWNDLFLNLTNQNIYKRLIAPITAAILWHCDCNN